YCQKYAKPEDVGAAAPEEKSSDEELSEAEYDSADDAVAGPLVKLWGIFLADNKPLKLASGVIIRIKLESSSSLALGLASSISAPALSVTSNQFFNSLSFHGSQMSWRHTSMAALTEPQIPWLQVTPPASAIVFAILVDTRDLSSSRLTFQYYRNNHDAANK
ncbi:Ubiquitin-conjugating enzyme E2 5, partial [Datura stramonium]|nr:Ubiquitin-conjugating enzyme E2 5 [Datura stramonium]